MYTYIYIYIYICEYVNGGSFIGQHTIVVLSDTKFIKHKQETMVFSPIQPPPI